MIDELKVSAHYSNTDLYKKIENGLIELGISLDSVNIENLSLVDDFHIGGVTATQFIADHLNLDREKTILDIGCGIGGPARYMAKMSECMVHGIDLTQNYIETGIQLNALVGLDDKVNLKQGSALALPYDNFSFDGAYMIHVGMNIERKNQLMAEVFRVLKEGNNFVLFDVMKITDEAIDYPMPWAEKIEESAVDKVQAYETALGEAGFRILDVEDKNQFAINFFETMIARMREVGARPLGLHLLMGDNTKEKVMNAYKQIRDGRLSPILMVAQK